MKNAESARVGLEWLARQRGEGLDLSRERSMGQSDQIVN